MNNSLLEAVREFAPNVGVSSKTVVVRKQRDTIEEARAKVVEKLNRCIDHVNSDKAIDDNDLTDPVFKEVSEGVYIVGAKYGNRWLPNLAGDNKRVLTDIDQAELANTLNAIITHVESGDSDSDLRSIQATNAKRKSRKAA